MTGSIQQSVAASNLKYPTINLNKLKFFVPFFEFALNMAILAMVIPLSSLAMFFSIAFLLVILRWYVSPVLKKIVKMPGVIILTFGFIYLKSPEFVIGFLPATLKIFSIEALKALNLLGIGYCYLKSISALLEPTLNPWHFARYYFFLPTFFSGPIMTPNAFCAENIYFNKENFLDGVARIVFGIIKFVLSSFMQLCIPLANLNASHPTLALQSYPFIMLWFTTLMCGVWLYLNFSAFTDIAIGVGRILGYNIPENFNNPFAATDLTDFWRRWHITLGDWLRGHIFNPLARILSGFMPSLIIAMVTALITMGICGLWHQPNKAFLIWGLLHGAGLAFHQMWRQYIRPLIFPFILNTFFYRSASWCITHIYIGFTWVFFFPVNAATFDLHLEYAKRLLCF